MNKFRPWLLYVFGCACFCITAQATPTTNGLYAGIVTSEGTIWCSWRYDLVPRAAANFVSLADGTKTWLDYATAAT